MDQTTQGFQGLKGGDVQEFLTIDNEFSNIEKSDVLAIRKAGNIVSLPGIGAATSVLGRRPSKSGSPWGVGCVCPLPFPPPPSVLALTVRQQQAR